MIDIWIELAARATNQVPVRLAKSELDRIMGTIRSRFTSPISATKPLWEEFVDTVSARTEMGWKIACEYPVEKPVLIVQDGSESIGYRFSSRDSMFVILAESPGFEFYVTADDVDFALCFNHHDELIGVGNCRAWLADRLTRSGRNGSFRESSP